MAIRIFTVILIIAVQSAAHQEKSSRIWALGIDLPLHQGGTSLWRTGEKWGYGITLGGPNMGTFGCCEDAYFNYGFLSLTLQRYKGRMFFFGEIAAKGQDEDRYYQRHGGGFSLKAGVGISRRYKDFGVRISHGFGYQGWDGAGVTEIVGVDDFPRVVVYWTL